MSQTFKVKEGMEEEYLKNKASCEGDFYRMGIFRYAERWGSLMEQEMRNGATVAQVAERTSDQADTDGITGFMYGQAVRILSGYWEHGEELRQWHNQKYGYEGQGVVNPAVWTISEKMPEEDAEVQEENGEAPTMTM